MSTASSLWYRAGQVHGAYDAARPARLRRGYHPAYARSWMYRRGFARAFLAARRAAPPWAGGPWRWRAPGGDLAAVQGQPDALALMAQIGRLDTAPQTIGAMRQALDDSWAALEAAGWRWPAGEHAT